jgi:hypothetical protein
MRLVGAITLRALRLWEKILRPSGKLSVNTSDQIQELDKEVRAVLENKAEGGNEAK